MRGMGKRILQAALFCLLVLIWAGSARAEVSANLQKKEEIGQRSHRVELEAYFDADGNPAFADDLGYAYVRYTYNGKPRCIRTECYDLDGSLIRCAAGYAVITQSWDGNGRLLEKYYWDEAEKPVLGPEGYHGVIYKYDHRKLIMIRYVDTDGNPLDSPKLASKVVYTYNDKRLRIVEEYYGPDGQYRNNAQGWARVEREYGKNKVVTREFFFDADGNMVYVKSKKYAGFRKTVNIRNQVTRVEYLGADGSPIMYNGQYAYVVYDYAAGVKNPVRETYYDADGLPVLQKGGYASVEYTYANPAASRPQTAAYFNEYGERVVIEEGYSRVYRMYLQSGEVYRELYYDTEDHLMINPNTGCAGVDRHYSGSRMRSETFLDTEKNPMTLPDGYSTIQYLYEHGRVTGILYANEKGERVTTASGIAGELRSYDEDGRLTERTYVNESNEPVNGRNGYATARYTYYTDAVQSVSYFHADGTPAKGEKGAYREAYAYDAFGETAEIRLLDAQDRPMNGSQGWAVFRQERNEKKKITRTAYSDADGQPADGPDGFAVRETDYNEAGKQIRVRTIAIQPENAAGKTPEVFYDYDEEGILRTVRYTDGSGNPWVTRNGYSTIAYRYDEAGRRYVTMYYDGDGNAAPQGEGYCGTMTVYDAEGNSAGTLYLNADGTFFRMKNGAYGARQTTEKSESGKKLSAETVWLDRDGSPAPIASGYTATHTVYDEAERISTISFLDAEMKPCADTSGKYGVRYEWDAEGHRTATVYLDEKGKPADSADGYCRIEYTYEGDKAVKAEYFNAAGEQVPRP